MNPNDFFTLKLDPPSSDLAELALVRPQFDHRINHKTSDQRS
jgi:hypothetical protein